MNDLELFISVVKVFDSTIALALAVWVIWIGGKRWDTLSSTYTDANKAVLEQQHIENKALMALVSEMALGKVPEDADPKALKKGSG